MKNSSLVFDFDSTIIKEESLELIAGEALAANPHKQEILEEIKKITELGMRGELSIAESLTRRLSMMQATFAHVEKIVTTMPTHISESFRTHADFFKNYGGEVHIVSSGFTALILPVARALNILPKNVHANSLLYGSDGAVTGVDRQILLAQDQGKVRQVLSLNLPHPIVMIGDGYTDYEVKKFGSADIFIAYTEHVARDRVTEPADFIARSFDEVLTVLQIG